MASLAVGTSPAPAAPVVDTAGLDDHLLDGHRLRLHAAGLRLRAPTPSKSGWTDRPRWAILYGQNLVISLTIGFVIQILFKLAFALVDIRRILALQGWQRSLFFSGIPLLGTVIGWPIGISLVFGSLRQFSGADFGQHRLAGGAVPADRLRLPWPTSRCATRRIRAEMRASEAQLRLLQGQMEPRFPVQHAGQRHQPDRRRRAAPQADAGRTHRLLARLADGFARRRRRWPTRLSLARRYLQLMHTRMGDRLRFEIAADATIARARPDATGAPAVDRERRQARPGAASRRRHRAGGGDARRHRRHRLAAGLCRGRRCRPGGATRRPRAVAGGADGNGIALANLRERLQSRFGRGAGKRP